MRKFNVLIQTEGAGLSRILSLVDELGDKAEVLNIELHKEPVVADSSMVKSSENMTPGHGRSSGSLGSAGRHIKPARSRKRGIRKEPWEHDASLILLQQLRTGPCKLHELEDAVAAEKYSMMTARSRLADMVRAGILRWEVVEDARVYTIISDPASWPKES